MNYTRSLVGTRRCLVWAGTLLLLPLNGCVFAQLHAGYYGASHSPGGSPDTQLTGVTGGPGYGLRVGTYLDYPRDNELVRVALAIGSEAFTGSSDQGSFKATPGGISARADITVYRIQDYQRVRLTAEFTPSSGGKFKSPGDQTYSIKNSLGYLLGASYMWGDRDRSVAATLGYRAIKLKNPSRNIETPSGGDSIGSGDLTFRGVEAQATYSGNVLALFSDSSTTRRETILALQPRFEQTLNEDVDVLQPFEDAARQLGCELYFPSKRVIARCTSFSVGVRQRGRQITYLCEPRVEVSDCKQYVGRIVKRASEELVEGEKLEVQWSKELSSDTDVSKLFEDGASKAGCKTKHEGARLVAVCAKGTVGVEQKGSKVDFLCSSKLDVAGCKAVVQDILQAAKGTSSP